jgi:hypothetical protein
MLWVDLAEQILNTDMLRNIKRLYSSSSKAIEMLRVKKKSSLGAKLGQGIGFLKNIFKG